MKISNKNRLLFALLIGTLGVTLAGCKDSGPSSKVYVRKDNVARTLKIAVLGFSNLAPRSDEADEVVTNAVVTYLLSTGAFDVVEPGLVDQAVKEQRIIPPPSGIDMKTAGLLRDALGVDAILTGTVEDYGDVRVGNETYPSVSFSVRLIDAKDASIVWAGMVSKTGADKVLLFDIGRVSSMGKLVKSAVQTMAAAMRRDQARIMATLSVSGTSQATSPAGGQGPAPASASPAATSSTTVATTTAPSASSTATAGAGASKDENKTYTEDDLKALLPDVPGFTKKDVEYSKHYHGTVKLKYQIGETPQFVEVEFVDYLKMAQTQKFLQTEHSKETVGEFNGLPAFITTSEFNYYHVDVAVGRFGLFVAGPVGSKAEVEKLATALIDAL